MVKPCGASPTMPRWEISVETRANRRNGMDCDPQSSGDVRSWQMSPFSAERFDLDEIQRAEKRGVKGKYELERLLILYGKKGNQQEVVVKTPPCQVCAERDAVEKTREKKESRKPKIPRDYLYQPYGPIMNPAISFSRPEYNTPRPYGVMGPSPYTYFMRRPGGETAYRCIPADSPFAREKFPYYTPLGPSTEIRLKPDMYVCMGPNMI